MGGNQNIYSDSDPLGIFLVLEVLQNKGFQAIRTPVLFGEEARVLGRESVILSASTTPSGDFEVIRFYPGEQERAVREVYRADPTRLRVVLALEETGQVVGDAIRWEAPAT
jgi:hypothetical protein